MPDMSVLKNVNWQRHGNTILKILLDLKVLGLFLFNGVMVYGMSDTFFKPSLDGLKSRDEAIQAQRKELEGKENLQKQYKVWEQQLKNLDTLLIPISAGNSGKVISVSEASELLDLAQGKLRDTKVLPALQPPHDKRESISLLQTANSTFDILKPEGDSTEGGTPPPSPTEPNPSAPPAPAASGQPDTSLTTSGSGAATTMPVERYDYDLRVSATYPALMDLLNELVIRKKLIRINKIVISKPITSLEEQPDAKDFPDYPLKLDMIVSLSIFLYESKTPTAT